jgi:hypothetical protein
MRCCADRPLAWLSVEETGPVALEAVALGAGRHDRYDGRMRPLFMRLPGVHAPSVASKLPPVLQLMPNTWDPSLPLLMFCCAVIIQVPCQCDKPPTTPYTHPLHVQQQLLTALV